LVVIQDGKWERIHSEDFKDEKPGEKDLKVLSGAIAWDEEDEIPF
jgi:hypothetical protein